MFLNFNGGGLATFEMGNIKGLYVKLGCVSGRFGTVRVTGRVGKGRWSAKLRERQI
ncbi:hypothetical protein HanPSC8_Chr09g0359551 [Helianthus annuus]|nr:hypothetical protein HanPSC8_Chr09g0359551 [Helianthus annuus]